MVSERGSSVIGFLAATKMKSNAPKILHLPKPLEILYRYVYGYSQILHIYSRHKKQGKQAGAELCQAQFKLGQLNQLQSAMLASLLSSYASLLSSQLYYLTLQLATLDYDSKSPPHPPPHTSNSCQLCQQTPRLFKLAKFLLYQSQLKLGSDHGCLPLTK